MPHCMMQLGAGIIWQRNMSTADGLVNHAMGTVEWAQADDNSIPGE